MIGTPPTVILLRRGEVLVDFILIFRRGSSSASLPFEFLSGTSYNFSSFSFFLLSFLASFSVICVSRFLFPFLFLSFLSIVTSHC
jgi:hypothetical protein